MNIKTEIDLKCLLKARMMETDKRATLDGIRTVEMGITDGDASARISVIGFPANSEEDRVPIWAIEFSREFDSNVCHAIWSRIPSGEELLKWFELSFKEDMTLPEGLLLPQSDWMGALTPYMK